MSNSEAKKGHLMEKVVTIAIPVYKRLDFLPRALASVSAQDYPHIELIVSDNGMNEPGLVEQIVAEHYRRPFVFRRNPITVPPAVHYTELVGVASGEYFILLCDDDQISSNFASEMVASLEKYPRANLAVSQQKVIDLETNDLITSSVADLPELIEGSEFVRGWASRRYNYQTLVTVCVRTEVLCMRGGFPNFPNALHSDEGMVVNMAIGGYVVVNQNCTFYWNKHASSMGLTCSYKDFALENRLFIRYLDSNPHIQTFARAHPQIWAMTRKTVLHYIWGTYIWGWQTIHRHRLSYWEWTKAALLYMPLVPALYLRVLRIWLVITRLEILKHCRRILLRPATME
jgi:glycosyltransferase involved in cell wall biosynthesis